MPRKKKNGKTSKPAETTTSSTTTPQINPITQAVGLAQEFGDEHFLSFYAACFQTGDNPTPIQTAPSTENLTPKERELRKKLRTKLKSALRDKTENEQFKALYNFACMRDDHYCCNALAYFYLYGIGVERNPKMAMTLWRRIYNGYSYEYAVKPLKYLVENKLAFRSIHANKEDMSWYMKMSTEGDPIYQVEIFNVYLSGLNQSFDKDAPEVLEDIEKLASNGNTPAMLALSIYYRKIGDLEKSYDYCQKAANLGNVRAYGILSIFYSDGHSFKGREIKKDIDISYKKALQSAQLGDLSSMLSLYLLHQKEDRKFAHLFSKEEAVKWLEKAANYGLIRAKGFLKQYSITQIISEKDIAEEEFPDFLQQAFNKLDKFSIGFYYSFIEPNPAKLKKASELMGSTIDTITINDPDIIQSIAGLDDPKKTLEEKFQILEKAANRWCCNNSIFTNGLASFHLYGIGTEKSLARANLRWDQADLQLDDSIARSFLRGYETEIYELSKGNDSAEGENQGLIKWHEQEAVQGSVISMASLAGFYESISHSQPSSIRKIYQKKSFDMLLRAAQGGYTPAMNSLYQSYIMGILVEKDLQEAVRWCSKGVENKDSTAYANFGSHLFYQGQKSEGLGLIYQSTELGSDIGKVSLFSILRNLQNELPNLDPRFGLVFLKRAAASGRVSEAAKIYQRIIINNNTQSALLRNVAKLNENEEDAIIKANEPIIKGYIAPNNVEEQELIQVEEVDFTSIQRAVYQNQTSAVEKASRAKDFIFLTFYYGYLERNEVKFMETINECVKQHVIKLPSFTTKELEVINKLKNVQLSFEEKFKILEEGANRLDSKNLHETVAKLHFYGVGTAESAEMAYLRYKRSLEKGSTVAANNIEFLVHNYPLFGVKSFDNQSEKGEQALFRYLITEASGAKSAIAQHALSQLYLSKSISQLLIQINSPEDFKKKSFELCLQSARNGYSPAMEYLSEKYFEGIGTPKNIAEAIKWNKKAEENVYNPMHDIASMDLLEVVRQAGENLGMKLAGPEYLAGQRVGELIMGAVRKSDHEESDHEKKIKEQKKKQATARKAKVAAEKKAEAEKERKKAARKERREKQRLERAEKKEADLKKRLEAEQVARLAKQAEELAEEEANRRAQEEAEKLAQQSEEAAQKLRELIKQNSRNASQVERRKRQRDARGGGTTRLTEKQKSELEKQKEKEKKRKEEEIRKKAEEERRVARQKERRDARLKRRAQRREQYAEEDRIRIVVKASEMVNEEEELEKQKREQEAIKTSEAKIRVVNEAAAREELCKKLELLRKAKEAKIRAFEEQSHTKSKKLQATNPKQFELQEAAFIAYGCKDGETSLQFEQSMDEILSSLADKQVIENLRKILPNLQFQLRGSYIYQHWHPLYKGTPPDLDVLIIADLSKLQKGQYKQLLEVLGLETEQYDIIAWKGKDGNGPLKTLTIKPKEGVEETNSYVSSKTSPKVEVTICDIRSIDHRRKWVANSDKLTVTFDEEGYRVASCTQDLRYNRYNVDHEACTKLLTDNIRNGRTTINYKAKKLFERICRYYETGLVDEYDLYEYAQGCVIPYSAIEGFVDSIKNHKNLTESPQTDRVESPSTSSGSNPSTPQTPLSSTTSASTSSQPSPRAVTKLVNSEKPQNINQESRGQVHVMLPKNQLKSKGIFC